MTDLLKTDETAVSFITRRTGGFDEVRNKVQPDWGRVRARQDRVALTVKGAMPENRLREHHEDDLL